MSDLELRIEILGFLLSSAYEHAVNQRTITFLEESMRVLSDIRIDI